MQALAQDFKDDPNLFDFWCDQTINYPFERKYDWEGNPRQTALNTLVRQYPTQPKTLELLRDRAQNDSDPQLKEWAANQLAKLEP